MTDVNFRETTVSEVSSHTQFECAQYTPGPSVMTPDKTGKLRGHSHLPLQVIRHFYFDIVITHTKHSLTV